MTRTVRLTHPFHADVGHMFPLLDYCQTWGKDRVCVHDDDGRAWTHAAPVDPSMAVRARNPLDCP
jgi:hypothetical protein